MNEQIIDHKYDLLLSQLQAFHLTGKNLYTFEPSDTLIIYDACMKNIARYLAKNKMKENRVAVVINDQSNNFIMGIAIDYESAENEEDEMPGNWEIVASFDADKILGKPKEVIYNLQDTAFLESLRMLLLYHNNITIDRDALHTLLIIYFGALLETIKQGANTDNNTPYTLPLGDMNVTGQVEDGKIVTAIELQGTLKAIAKDDTSLEDINVN